MRALFLGLGGIGQRHLRNLRMLEPGCEIGAVRHLGRRFEIGDDLRADHNIDIVSKYRIATFSSIETAITDFKPDFGIVSSPSSCHAPQTLTLIAGGVPVLLEKPACVTVDELETLLAATRRSGVLVQVCYMLRFNPAVRRLREMIAERKLGRLYAIHGEASSYLPAWHPYERPVDFYAARADLGGGVILTEIHLVDLLHAMLGAPRRLWSVGGTLSPESFDVEDTVTSLMEYPVDGRDIPVSLAVSFVDKVPRTSLTIKGEKGSIVWTLGNNTVLFEDAIAGVRESFVVDGFERNSMFVEEMRHMLDCLRGKARPQAALADVAGGQRMALAMRESLRRGMPVDLDGSPAARGGS